MINLQITLFSTTGKYKPMSTIIKVESKQEYINNKKLLQQKAILNICHNRRTTIDALKEQGYTIVKVREYDIEKIEKQKVINKIKNIKKTIDKTKQ